MWVFKDDHTDVRVLAAFAKALPEVVGLRAVEQFITDTLQNSLKIASAQTAFQRFTVIDVKPGRDFKLLMPIPRIALVVDTAAAARQWDGQRLLPMPQCGAGRSFVRMVVTNL